MKMSRLVLTATLLATAIHGSHAEGTKMTKPRKAKDAAAQQAAPVNYEKKIAEMQKSIDDLRFEIEKIRAERNELQIKLQQSDREIAERMKKIEDIKTKLAAKQKEAEALQAKKKR